MRRLSISLLALAALGAAPARAASFDAEGHLVFDPAAIVTQSFEQDGQLAEGGTYAVSCANTCSYQVLGDKPADETALDGRRFIRMTEQTDPFEVELPLPKTDAAYRFRLWVRHARVAARAVFSYDTAAGRGDEPGYLFPTGRVTSDGWVELESNPVSVTGSALTRAVMRVEGAGVDLDAIEVVPAGDYDGGSKCLGAFDPVCGPEAVCIAERCQQGARFVPPIPPETYRESVASYFASRIRDFFGGHFSRMHNMPAALAEIEKMRTATTPWQYWEAFFHGVRLLRDWHTATSLAIAGARSTRRLGLCFIEGNADLSRDTWPSAPDHLDVMVAYTGTTNTMGLGPGDRLVAVDGENPIDWARSLDAQDFGYHVATDASVDADLVETMRDLIPTFARTFSVIRCDPATKTCSDQIETINVTDIPPVSGGGGFGSSGIPACDNRPEYHLLNPPASAASHRMYSAQWRDLVADSQPGENIYGMTFDSLDGRTMDGWLSASNDFARQNARGLIIDHRAGNGGTLDAPETITELVRQTQTLSVSGFMRVAAFDGPADTAEGLQLFNQFKANSLMVYDVGSNDPDVSLPVALIIHRDGSASDWLPHGMKGAPNVRIFGPHQTAGAFSSFFQYGYWSRMDWQVASGETITADGSALIGHGIQPDEIVEHTQTSLMERRDLPYEAALAWVRSRLP